VTSDRRLDESEVLCVDWTHSINPSGFHVFAGGFPGDFVFISQGVLQLALSGRNAFGSDDGAPIINAPRSVQGEGHKEHTFYLQDISGGSEMSILSVDGFHTILLCRNWEECVTFYRDILGFKTVDSKPGFIEVEVAQGAHIGLIRRSKDDDMGNIAFGLILTFRVANLEKVHASLAALSQCVTEIMVHPWGARLFKMRDPEGRPLEIWTQN
jgi:catechol 2,3-dioxygenase-like lactoylglutathione lyase family enzyme